MVYSIVMELNKIFIASIEKGGKKKVKYSSFIHPVLNREFAIHIDIDNPNHTSISDIITGYRLFGFPVKLESVNENQISQRFESYIKHYTVELINKEFEKIEAKQKELENKENE